jgi:hypothetical protein
VPAAPPATPTGVAPILGSAPCANAIRDQANPGSCIEASTAPALGKIYPLSANLFVSSNGDVGIGTGEPAAKLEVAGTARITDTLTLAPPGDMALDVSTGSIYKGGALFIHTKGGCDNTALGQEALAMVTTGYATLPVDVPPSTPTRPATATPPAGMPPFTPTPPASRTPLAEIRHSLPTRPDPATPPAGSGRSATT